MFVRGWKGGMPRQAPVTRFQIGIAVVDPANAIFRYA